MMRNESSPRCPKCGCANGHNCEYEPCSRCGQRGHAVVALYADGDVRVPPRGSLSDALFPAA